MNNIIDDIAQQIRIVDGGNTMTARDLGIAIAPSVTTGLADLECDDVVAFVERTNPDKAMGAGQLAELIVAEFDLDKED